MALNLNGVEIVVEAPSFPAAIVAEPPSASQETVVPVRGAPGAEGPQGPEGPAGPPGPPGDGSDVPDLTLLFENGLV